MSERPIFILLEDILDVICHINIEIERNKMISLRNRIIHASFDVVNRIVWDVVHRRLPLLKQQIQSLIQTLNK